MTLAYRLHSSRYPASSGQGAAINGGRWNPKGIPVVYASASPSLAVLEILAHYSVLPRDFVLTTISIPDWLRIEDVSETVLTSGWDEPTPTSGTQEYGRQWANRKESVVLKVPSTIIRKESNYVINVLHPDFSKVIIGPSEAFRFDPRLK